jgi:hypothetical protein
MLTMSDPDRESDLDLAMRLVRSGELPAAHIVPALLDSDLVVLVDSAAAHGQVNPLVVHRGDSTFVAAFTAADRVPEGFGRGRNALTIPGRVLIAGSSPGVGLVVDPGSERTMEIPSSALTALRESSWPSTRYFVREHLVDGRTVPVSVFRRTMTPDGPVDERLLDVDSWTDDRHGTVDKAIRFPLDADIEEISPEAAQDVFDMVARRSYEPLTRR